MIADPKALIAKLTTLRDLLRKNCGTGVGGFQTGNHCAVGRSGGAGSARRKRAAKNRRKRGPGKKPNPKARQKRGIDRQDRRQWESHHPEIRAEHHEARRDLATTIRNERAEHREQRSFDRSETARMIREERNDNRTERRSERSATAHRQAREVARLDAAIGRQNERIAGKPQAVRDRVAEAQRDRRAELLKTHTAERSDLVASQREARQEERESHREQAADYRNEEREGRRESHAEHRSQIDELRAEQRRERREASKSYSWIDVRAVKGDGVPTAQAILDGVLEETGHAEAWADGSLRGNVRLAVLRGVQFAARAWLRREAQSVIDDLTEKSLFGAAKSKVAQFFGRAKQFIREMAAAGLLAIAGPGDVRQGDAVAVGYEQQVKIQQEYLANFEQQIVLENKPLDATFVARAEQYGSAAWSMTQNALHEAAVANGRMKFERRVHEGKRKPGDPCAQCLALEKKKWQPIGSLPRIGEQTPCGDKCHCYFQYCEYIGGPRYFEDEGRYFELEGDWDAHEAQEEDES